HEQVRTMDGDGLGADDSLQGSLDTVEQRQDSPIKRDADERYHLRPVLPDLSLEHFPAFDIFGRAKIVDSRTWPRNEIRNAETPFRKPMVVLICHRLRHQLRTAQEFPEAIRVSCKMVPSDRRADAWVNAHEKHVQTWGDAILQAQF